MTLNHLLIAFAILLPSLRTFSQAWFENHGRWELRIQCPLPLVARCAKSLCENTSPYEILMFPMFGRSICIRGFYYHARYIYVLDVEMEA